MESSVSFLNEVLRIIKERDPLHFRTLKRKVSLGQEFRLLNAHVTLYFRASGITPEQVTDDYLKMVGDMRREEAFFIRTGEYSCRNQDEAYMEVYSKPEVMRYYMNALLISQVLWKHHFEMYLYFARTFDLFWINYRNYRVLDVGAGHGLFSWAIKQRNAEARIDILDVSATSIAMAKKMLGENEICYLNTELSTINRELRYELIIMGEILEHVDDPVEMLKEASGHLSERGLVFFTVPTNAPAIDHVSLFRNKEEVLTMIEEAGMGWLSLKTIKVDSQTELIGAFCIKK